MENLEIYNAFKQPPKEALRAIQGGRLAGKTDINPQWRYKAMTEQFGVCGVGWKYEIVRVFSEPASEGQVFAFAEVKLFIKQGEAWSDPIPGYGGSMLVEKEKAGLHTSDEGYKMAITDALSTAMKMLGVAADIYAGLWDGAKYRDAPKAPEPKLEPKEPALSEAKSPAPESPPTGKKVQNIAELKSLMMKHKIGTHEAYEILSIKGFLELTDLDEAWAKIKEAKGLE